MCFGRAVQSLGEATSRSGVGNACVNRQQLSGAEQFRIAPEAPNRAINPWAGCWPTNDHVGGSRSMRRGSYVKQSASS
jgi:hypothetical protein